MLVPTDGYKQIKRSRIKDAVTFQKVDDNTFSIDDNGIFQAQRSLADSFSTPKATGPAMRAPAIMAALPATTPPRVPLPLPSSKDEIPSPPRSAGFGMGEDMRVVEPSSASSNTKPVAALEGGF